MILNKPLVIRNLSLNVPLLLAPMAGLTHSALRTLLLGFGGVGLLSTEMLSARRLPSENDTISPYLVRTPRERPLSYQLLVSDFREVAPAVDALHRFDADVIDLNLGCPAPKIRAVGGGSSLMEQPQQTMQIVAETRKRTELPLSVKIRLGENLDQHTLRNFCRLLEGEGIDMLTVHARLRRESFNRPPRWEWVARVKEWVAIPVIANGSVFSVEDARKCLAVSNADGLMIGRGAAQKPWLFAQVAKRIYGVDLPEPTICLPGIYLEFLKSLERFGQERRLGRLKEFTSYFAANYTFGHRLKAAVQGSGDVDVARRRALEFFEKNDANALHAALSAGAD